MKWEGYDRCDFCAAKPMEPCHVRNEWTRVLSKPHNGRRLLTAASSRAARKAYVERLPWVKVLREPVHCSHLAGSPPMYAHRLDPADPRRKRWECKRTARWTYRTLWKPLDARPVCWDHLRVLASSMEEVDRISRWSERTGITWKDFL